MNARHRSAARRRFLTTGVLAWASAAPPARALGRLFGPKLVEQAWDPRARDFVSADAALARIASARVALLGETHDNPRQHEIQRAAIESALAAGRSPALAMEQFDVEWQAALDAARAGASTPLDLVHAGHGSDGWKWPLYEPLLALALAHHLPIVALNLARAPARAIVRAGLDALGPDEVRRLALDRTWSPQRQALQRQAIVDGHCGEDSPVIDRLVQAQRARDAVMADRILGACSGGLIATVGRGHARRDVGVPLYLAARAPDLEVVSVGLVEAQSGLDAPERYSEAGAGRFDLLWFTRAQDRDDPCAAAPLPR